MTKEQGAAIEGEMKRRQIRLGCLRAALELRAPATAPADTLKIADEFYAWVCTPTAKSDG